MTEVGKSRGRWSVALGVAALVWAAGTFLAFRSLDPILAAFVAIVGVTVLGIAVAARGWDTHSTYEQREDARARKRAEKWERSAGARARDRARWEEHQARQAKKSGGN